MVCAVQIIMTDTIPILQKLQGEGGVHGYQCCTRGLRGGHQCCTYTMFRKDWGGGGAQFMCMIKKNNTPFSST